MAPPLSSSSARKNGETLIQQRPYQSMTRGENFVPSSSRSSSSTSSSSRVDDRGRPSSEAVVDSKFSSTTTHQWKEQRQHPQQRRREQRREERQEPRPLGLTSIAKSAYARARRMRKGWSCQGIEAYGPLDDCISFQPLAGASVVIIMANYLKKGDEHREYFGCAVESMGGRWVRGLRVDGGTITHAIWIDADDLTRDPSRLTSQTLANLNTCLKRDIPVVGTEWLEKIGELNPGQHWSEVDVGCLIPRAVKVFSDSYYGGKRDSSPRVKSPGRKNVLSSGRRDTATSLSASISETYRILLDNNPDALEKDALRRAMELSMLDFAVIARDESAHLGKATPAASPHEILQVRHDASMKEIKDAYRRRALETHPDKGGEPGAFEAVAHSYRMLLNAANGNGGSFEKDDDEISAIRPSAHWDMELKEHSSMVRELFDRHGDLSDNIRRQDVALARLGLCHKDAGSQNYNEKNQRIGNSCFYLSLAVSYLAGIEALAVWNTPDVDDDPNMVLLRKADDALIGGTALQLKRTIETAVLSAHPEWAVKGLVGEEVQAFADFLVYAFESTFISDWAVAIFDSTSGFVDVYKGKHYNDECNSSDETGAASNTLTLRYVPGHYIPLVPASPDSIRPSLKNMISTLDQCGVLFVVTDGAAE